MASWDRTMVVATVNQGRDHRATSLSAHDPRRAFTLLELLLSLVVFAAIASIALPGAALLLADRKIVRGADQLRIEMTRMRVDAMRSGRVMMIEAAIDGNTFRSRPYFSATDSVESSDQSSGQSGLISGADQAVVTAITIDPSATDEFEIPQELTIQSVQVVTAARGAEISQAATFNQDVGGEGKQWSQPILFYPDGTTSTAAVTIADDVYGKVIVKLRGITGDVSVTEVSP
jgi:prepilin-type N-terminal cleavage/methylation domain-containing protein